MKNKLWILLLLLLLPMLLIACDDEPSSTGNGSDTATETDGTEPPSDQPYELKFISNRDGTCYVSDIVYNESYEGNIHLEIPATSPDGERVVYVLSDKQTPLLPRLILKEDFEAHILQPMEEACERGEFIQFYLEKFLNYFDLYEITDALSVNKMTQILREQPLAEYAPVYQLNWDLTDNEQTWVTTYLLSYTEYSIEQKQQDDRHLISVLSPHLSSDELKSYIDQYALRKNMVHQVTALTVPEGVVAIGDCFANYDSLESITLPDSLLYIGSDAFDETAYMRAKYLDDEKGPIYIGNHLIVGDDEIEGELVVRDGTVSIAARAFDCWASITSVTLPASLKGIGYEAFQNCNDLERVNFKGSVEEWVALCAGHVFRYAKNGVTKMLFVTATRQTNPIFHAGHLFIDGEEITEITIPETVTRIHQYAFAQWVGLRSVVIPAHVERIDPMAFLGNKDLKIYAEVPAKPVNWESNWCDTNVEVIWGYQPAS